MSATAMAYSGRNPNFGFLKICFMMVFVILCTHALLKHGSDAIAVKECYERNGPVETWYLGKNDKRSASICRLSNGQYGILVMEGDNVVTAFIKNRMKNISQVRIYLVNRGYCPPTSCGVPSPVPIP